jgi:hypothetical protein
MILRKSLLVLLVALCGPAGLQAARPVEFRFSVPEAGISNPFARQIQAEVILPSGRRIALPAFVDGLGAFAVRARPVEAGTYALGAVSEALPGGKLVNLTALPLGDDHQMVSVSDVERLPAVRVNPKDPHQFIRSDGVPYLPIGANVAWPPDGQAADRYYPAALAKFAAARLTWMRVWMAHWSGLNLDWLPVGAGFSPKPPALDLDVAQRWDRIVESADDDGVYLQMVLQYHGQYTTYNDSNWAQNPWNAANPDGWLTNPADFFTDAKARLITMLKYRYIVARWGWSPAVFAWELFNEVHWTNAMREGHEDAVAKWHDDMAGVIRTCDIYHHLITTSTENLRSPVYAKLDFYQPHLYPSNPLAAARTFDPDASQLDKPVFYGESGDDHADIPAAETASGSTLAPAAWAALMGESQLPAQPWEGALMLDKDRAGALGVIHLFWAASEMARHPGLKPFSPPVYTLDHAPLVVRPGVQWLARPPADFTMPLDGSIPLEVGNWSGIYAGSGAGSAKGIPTRSTLHFDLPDHTTMHASIVGMGGGASAGLNFILDGQVVATGSWTKADGLSAQHPADVEFPVVAGHHTLVIANTGAGGWVGLGSLDFGVDAPSLSAIGLRSANLIVAWLFHRGQVFSETGGAATGILELPDVPAGKWSLTWYDPDTGEPVATQPVEHFGGMLKLPTPTFAHDAALVLQSLNRR